MDADGQVGPADGARAEADRRPAGQLSVGLGHEGGRTLVARGDDPDPRALERVEQAEEGFARDREGIADAGRAQGVGDESADRPWTGHDLRLRVGLGLSGFSHRSLLGLRGFGRQFRLGLSGSGLDRGVGQGFVGCEDRVELGHGDCAPSVGVGPRRGCQR